MHCDIAPHYLILILHFALSLLFSFDVAVTVTVLPFLAFFLMVTFPEEVTDAYFLLETFQLTLVFVPFVVALSLYFFLRHDAQDGQSV